MPQYFPEGSLVGFTDWLNVITESNGVICISKTVSNDLRDWVNVNQSNNHKNFTVDWTHLGSDISNSIPTSGFPANSEIVLKKLKEKSSFLVVGTLEPRKGHAQVLKEFEKLWKNSVDINLVIVGKEGWKISDLIHKIEKHPELNKRLFWLNNATDEYLDKIYESSRCLIAGSYGEGFGLPIVEAAERGLSVIARDIPIFREVAGDYAIYFGKDNMPRLSDVIKKYLDSYKLSGTTKKKIKTMSWYQSAQKILQFLVAKN